MDKLRKEDRMRQSHITPIHHTWFLAVSGEEYVHKVLSPGVSEYENPSPRWMTCTRVF